MPDFIGQMISSVADPLMSCVARRQRWQRQRWESNTICWGPDETRPSVVIVDRALLRSTELASTASSSSGSKILGNIWELCMGLPKVMIYWNCACFLLNPLPQSIAVCGGARSAGGDWGLTGILSVHDPGTGGCLGFVADAGVGVAGSPSP